MLDQLDVVTRRSRDVITIAVRGELDLSGESRVKSEFDLALSSGARRIKLDLSELSFCDSSGLRALVCANRLAADRGTAFEIVRPRGQALQALEVSGLDQVLPLTLEPVRASARSRRRLLLVI